jgi:hypothetical protein
VDPGGLTALRRPPVVLFRKVVWIVDITARSGQSDRRRCSVIIA